MNDSASAPVVLVVSSPKAGSGTTTLIAHLAIGLLRQGVGVGLVDLEHHYRQLSRWLVQRDNVAQSQHDLVMPAFPMLRWPSPVEETDMVRRWPDIVRALAPGCELLLVDAPAGAGALSARLHQDADYIVSVVAESAPDIELLFETDEAGAETGRPGAYGRMIWQARARRNQRDSVEVPWLMVRQRALTGMPPAAVAADAADRFDRAQRLLGVQTGPTFREHPAWRLGLDEGLSLLDPPLDRQTFAEDARKQLRALLIALKLPHLEGTTYAF